MSKRRTRCSMVFVPAAMAVVVAHGGELNNTDGQGRSYAGSPVRIGQGEARIIVRTDAAGALSSISVAMSADVLDGLPAPMPGGPVTFSYLLPMPQTGPATVVDHVVVDWEAVGHPPSGVYDVPHFDFHFYTVSRGEIDRIAFSDDKASGDPSQQPPADLMAPGYVVPPGTAVPKMGVHAIDPRSAEFQQQPFTTTFIYGYYDRKQVFVEPMASLAFLKTRPSFSAPVPRPERYTRPGLYPSSYSIRYDDVAKGYEVTLGTFR